MLGEGRKIGRRVASGPSLHTPVLCQDEKNILPNLWVLEEFVVDDKKDLLGEEGIEGRCNHSTSELTG